MSESQFSSSRWTFWQAVSWVCFRSPEHIDCFSDRFHWSGFRLYNHPTSRAPYPPVVEENAFEAVRHALADGRIVGRFEGSQRDADFLHDLTTRRRNDDPDICDGIVFLRDDILRLWPGSGEPTAPDVLTTPEAHDPALPKAATRNQVNKQPCKTVKNGRGPKPILKERIANTILEELKCGEITEEELIKTKQDYWAKKYGVSRDTFCKSRDLALGKYKNSCKN